MAVYTQDDLRAACAGLAKSERGRAALVALMGWINEHGAGLDGENQMRVVCLLAGAWGRLAGTAWEEMERAIGPDVEAHPVLDPRDCSHNWLNGYCDLCGAVKPV